MCSTSMQRRTVTRLHQLALKIDWTYMTCSWQNSDDDSNDSKQNFNKRLRQDGTVFARLPTQMSWQKRKQGCALRLRAATYSSWLSRLWREKWTSNLWPKAGSSSWMVAENRSQKWQLQIYDLILSFYSFLFPIFLLIKLEPPFFLRWSRSCSR